MIPDELRYSGLNYFFSHLFFITFFDFTRRLKKSNAKIRILRTFHQEKEKERSVEEPIIPKILFPIKSIHRVNKTHPVLAKFGSLLFRLLTFPEEGRVSTNGRVATRIRLYKN